MNIYIVVTNVVDDVTFSRKYVNTHDHNIHDVIYWKTAKSYDKNLIFLILLLKTLIVETLQNCLAHTVLTSTHNLCFGSRIRKIGNCPAHPVLLYVKSVV